MLIRPIFDPRYAEAYILAGHLYRLMKRPADARAALTKADELGTSDPWLQNNWADLLIDEGKFDEAAQRYRRVIDSGTPNKEAMISAFEGLTRYYTSIGRPDEVDSFYRKQIAYEPDRAWTYGNYAQFLLCERDDYDAAISRKPWSGLGYAAFAAEGRTALGEIRDRLLLAEVKVPTFDGHLNSGNTSSREVFDGIQAAQEIDTGIQA